MSHNFDTNLKPNHRNFDRYARCKNITKPYIMGYFSVDQNRQFIPDYSKCQYLKLPRSNRNVHFNLNEGYEIIQHKPESAHNEKLDHILQFILLNLKKLRSEKCKEKFLNFNVICFRGKLRMLMCTPYEFREGWSLLATKWKGNIYLCGFETEREKAKRQTETGVSKKFCSYGFKFEQFLMSDSPTAEPDTSRPVLEGEEFCCMFASKLQTTVILYGAEMDALKSDTEVDLSKANLNDLKFAELKVRLKPSNQRQVENYHRYKMINWWCQSYLANIPEVIVGLRTDRGIVNELESINVSSMPRMCEKYWSSAVCLEFLDNFLCMLKHQLRDIDCPHTVFKFDYDPQKSSSIQCTAIKGPNIYSFLPDWYTDQVKQTNFNERSL